MQIIFISVIFLVGVAFYIVTERKVLGGLQLRHGPNKVRMKGYAQPLADGVKLLLKERIFPLRSIKLFYLAGPIVCFVCAYIL